MTAWWRDSVIYQVYVRSFADADGDGIGDLAGLRSKLDYLAELGVDAIWLNPCYVSPQRDHGYDISDYVAVDPVYGGTEALDAVVDDAHARGIRVIMDIVANHCSDQHAWFVRALAAGPGGPERARFIFRNGRGAEGELPPNNWQSVFGGSAWTRITDARGHAEQWYLHSFDPGQPDFNWRNPEVVAYFEQVLRFWFNRGVDGFRIDVAHGLFKHPDLPDWPGADRGTGGHNSAMWDQPEVHDVYRSWRSIGARHNPEKYFVGEIWVPTLERLDAYLAPDELHQAFGFDLLVQPWNAGRMRAAITRTLERAVSVGTLPAWTLNNHDVHRMVTRYGQEQPEGEVAQHDMIADARRTGSADLTVGSRRARAAVLLLLALPGTAYLYQGEELGLPEVFDLPEEARQDPIWFRSHGEELGRDGCRVPLPWRRDAPTFGFSDNQAPQSPWLPQPGWFGEYAVDTQETDPASSLALYRAALATRREVFDSAAELVWHETGNADVLAFSRGNGTCVVNFGEHPFPLPDGWELRAVRCSRSQSNDGELEQDSAVWFTGRPPGHTTVHTQRLPMRTEGHPLVSAAG